MSCAMLQNPAAKRVCVDLLPAHLGPCHPPPECCNPKFKHTDELQVTALTIVNNAPAKPARRVQPAEIAAALEILVIGQDFACLPIYTTNLWPAVITWLVDCCETPASLKCLENHMN